MSPALASRRYSIDGLGRQTLIPSSDSPTGGADIGMEYWANDGVKTITQGASVVSYTLDGAGRRLGETTTWAGGGGAQQVVRHYSDGSDNPSSVTTTTAGGVSTSRLVELGGEGLDLRVTVSAGQVAAELMVTSPRGDVVSTIEVDAQGSPEGLSGWSSFDEHGNPADQPTAASSSSGGVVYGWLGAHQRATTAVGLTLMGARVHNPVTGLFTSLDPVRGGGDTTYGYPNDPINNTDLDGQRWRRLWRVWRAKNYAESHVVGAAAGRLERRLGGKCEWSRGMRICGGSRWNPLIGRGGTTYGNTYLYSRKYRKESTAPGVIAHERVHVRQWWG